MVIQDVCACVRACVCVCVCARACKCMNDVCGGGEVGRGRIRMLQELR
jgi:hypothetical protein